jgi:RimJ/RimL family protein N-acetyltransferase
VERPRRGPPCRGIPELEGAAEIGWVCFPSCWGKGIASEAVALVLRRADIHVDAPAIRCIIESDNSASIRIARKQGFSRIGRRLIDGTPVEIFGRPRTSGG